MVHLMEVHIAHRCRYRNQVPVKYKLATDSLSACCKSCSRKQRYVQRHSWIIMAEMVLLKLRTVPDLGVVVTRWASIRRNKAPGQCPQALMCGYHSNPQELVLLGAPRWTGMLSFRKSGGGRSPPCECCVCGPGLTALL